MSYARQSAIAFVAVTLLAPTPAPAQYVPANPSQPARLSNNQPAAQTQAYQAGVVSGRVQGFDAGVASQSQQQQFGGYGGYGWNNPGPAGGYLQGVAAVTNANAQYQVTIQQARMAQSQADMSKVDVRRRIRDEEKYERMQMATPEQVRLNDMNASLARARANPPPTEIWSGVAFNDLLMAAQTMHRQGLYGPMIPLPPDILRNINVTTGTTRGSVRALNDGQKPRWPFTLKSGRFKATRDQLDILIPEVYGQAKSSQGVDPDMLRKTQGLVSQLEGDLRAAIADLTPDEYTSSKRFTTQLKEGLRVLEHPDAGNFTGGRWTAKGRSIGELIDELSRNGLKFAPATTGNESYYTSLYQYFASYDAALMRIGGGGALTAAPQQPRR